MILVDYSGSTFAAIAVELNRNFGTKTDIDFLRHIILNQLRSYNKRFRKEFGEMVICLDGKNNWRGKIFPAYKALRKKERASSGIDWKEVFKNIEILTEEFKKNLPYRFILMDDLEADDIIAILTKKFYNSSESSPVLIISNDKDYRQLHKYENVYQFLPRKKIIVREDNPEFFLKDLIVHGDKSDGIPNIRTDKNIFIENDGRRQVPVSTEFMRRFISEGTDFLSIFEKERYEFNKMLISFDEIPEEYTSIVIDKYNQSKPTFNKFDFFQYLAKNKLNKLIDNIGDF